MKKMIALALGAAMLISVLGACGQKDTAGEDTADTEVEETDTAEGGPVVGG